jgi:Cu/Ag efflux protein CusF
MATIGAGAREGQSRVGGAVTEVDEAAGTVTLDHEEIPNLKMPPMIMAWTVKDRVMLKGLKAGDKVEFEVADVDGQPKIVVIKKVK